MIKKVKGGFVVVSSKSKRLSKVMTKKKAQTRLRQIEYFKHRKK